MSKFRVVHNDHQNCYEIWDDKDKVYGRGFYHLELAQAETNKLNGLKIEGFLGWNCECCYICNSDHICLDEARTLMINGKERILCDTCAEFLGEEEE